MRKIWAFLLLIGCTYGHAWGPQGHRLVAKIAWDHMTPAARANTSWLLDGATMADVASWPDEFRGDNSQTGLWHYVSIPAEAEGYDRDRDCPVQTGVTKGTKSDTWRDCPVDRIDYFKKRINDPSLDRLDRGTAMKFLIHFIGDLHQPYHAYGVERGGNGILVTVFGKTQCGQWTCNFHSVWDSSLIDHRNLSDDATLAMMEKQIKDSKLAAGSLSSAEWANESHLLAREVWVTQGAHIEEDYYQKNIPHVDNRIELAGLRLAAVLNEAFPQMPAKKMKK